MNQTIPYSAMSKQDLITVAETQSKILHQIYGVVALPNTVLSPGEKLTWLVAQTLLKKQSPNEDGKVRFPVGETAELTGMSPKTTGRYVKNMAERFQATREVEPYTTSKGQDCFLVFVDPTEPLWIAPEEAPIAPEKERAINGNLCPRCGSSTFKKKKRIIASQDVGMCDTCGLHKVYPIVEENTPLEPGDYGLEEKASQSDNLLETEESSEEKRQELSILDCIHTSLSPFDSIPEELKALKQWACHRAKCPYDAKITTPMRMRDMLSSSTDETKWASFEQAVSTWQASQSWVLPYDGIGFMAKKENGYVFTDYDPNRETNTLDNPELVYKRVQFTDSYHEFSSSGVGIRGVASGTLPRNIKQPGLEMYDHDKFVVMTGNHLPGTPITIETRQEQVSALFAEIVPKHEQGRAKQCVSVPCGLPEQVVLKKCREGKKGAWFERLWTGDISGYPSQSEADLALCEELAYRSDNDMAMVEALFKQSALYREDRWKGKARIDETYGQGTLARARARGVQKAS